MNSRSPIQLDKCTPNPIRSSQLSKLRSQLTTVLDNLNGLLTTRVLGVQGLGSDPDADPETKLCIIFDLSAIALSNVVRARSFLSYVSLKSRVE